ncbi:MAG TPA: DUF2189 domain-containing protein [Roseomonas sp.]|jgi:uncharacterized membrane protein
MAQLLMTDRQSGAADPAIRRIGPADLWAALTAGWRDFLAAPTQLVFLAVIYPIVGLLAARAAWGGSLMPLFFPLVSGFALIGPIAALGIYELSRRLERGMPVSATDALDVRYSPALPSILTLGVVLLAIFVGWIAVARQILFETLGAGPLGTPVEFWHRVLGTEEGWRLILLGNGAGFLFAAVVLAITVVSFPLLLDRAVGMGVAIRTSLRAVLANPFTMALWGLIVAAMLAVGCALLFAGLAVAIPVLGHATWHLYRRVVV